MRIGVAGIGKMGAAIAARLIEVGHDVTVWNRTPDKAKAIAGATPRRDACGTYAARRRRYHLQPHRRCGARCRL